MPHILLLYLLFLVNKTDSINYVVDHLQAIAKARATAQYGNSTVITIQDLLDINHVKYFESINPVFMALIRGFLNKINS